MDAVYNFLMGIADLDGVSFGELHPNKRGRFWWRHELAAAYALLRKLQQGADYTRVGWLSVGPSRDVSFGVNNRSVEDRPGTYDLYIASQGQEGGTNG